jgi:hypothetical protein
MSPVAQQPTSDWTVGKRHPPLRSVLHLPEKVTDRLAHRTSASAAETAEHQVITGHGVEPRTSVFSMIPRPAHAGNETLNTL